MNTALGHAAGHRLGTLVTLRRDGRPQSSDIVYDVTDARFRISVTTDRAKTHNLRRDPRCLLHLSWPDTGSYLSFDCTAEVSAPAADPADDVADRLVEVYRAVAGEHPDWDEYRRAMVDEGRLIIELTPGGVVGRVNS